MHKGTRSTSLFILRIQEWLPQLTILVDVDGRIAIILLEIFKHSLETIRWHILLSSTTCHHYAVIR